MEVIFTEVHSNLIFFKIQPRDPDPGPRMEKYRNVEDKIFFHFQKLYFFAEKIKV